MGCCSSQVDRNLVPPDHPLLATAGGGSSGPNSLPPPPKKAVVHGNGHQNGSLPTVGYAEQGIIQQPGGSTASIIARFQAELFKGMELVESPPPTMATLEGAVGGQALQQVSKEEAAALQQERDMLRGELLVLAPIIRFFFKDELPDTQCSYVIPRDDDLDDFAVNYLRDLIEHILVAQGTLVLPLNTTGDGSCMMHAASRGMWGVELFSDLLRLKVLRELEDHKDWYCDKVTEDEWAAACREAGTNCQYLGNLHCVALAHVLQRPVFLYSSVADTQRLGSGFFGVAFSAFPVRLSPGDCCKQPMVIAWQSDHHNHFVPLVCVSATSAPQWPQPSTITPSAMPEMPIADPFDPPGPKADSQGDHGHPYLGPPPDRLREPVFIQDLIERVRELQANVEGRIRAQDPVLLTVDQLDAVLPSAAFKVKRPSILSWMGDMPEGTVSDPVLAESLRPRMDSAAQPQEAWRAAWEVYRDSHKQGGTTPVPDLLNHIPGQDPPTTLAQSESGQSNGDEGELVSTTAVHILQQRRQHRARRRHTAFSDIVRQAFHDARRMQGQALHAMPDAHDRAVDQQASYGAPPGGVLDYRAAAALVVRVVTELKVVQERPPVGVQVDQVPGEVFRWRVVFLPTGSSGNNAECAVSLDLLFAPGYPRVAPVFAPTTGRPCDEQAIDSINRLLAKYWTPLGELDNVLLAVCKALHPSVQDML